MAADISGPVFVIAGYPVVLLALDLFGGKCQKLMPPGTAEGKKVCQGNGISRREVPGIAPTGEERLTGEGYFTGLCVKTEKSLLLICNMIAQLRAKAGERRAGGQSGMIFRVCLRKEPFFAVAKIRTTLQLIVPPNAPGDFIRCRNGLRNRNRGRQNRDSLNRLLTLCFNRLEFRHCHVPAPSHGLLQHM